MKSKQLRIFELALVLAIAFLPAMVYSIAFVFTGQVRDNTNYTASNYITWIIDGILSVTLLFYVLYKNNRNYADIGLSLRFSWQDLFIGIGILIFTVALYAIIMHVVGLICPEFANHAMNPRNLGFINPQFKGFLILGSIIIPIQEELIVRGFTMSEIFYLTDRRILAVILSVSIQFSYHLYQGLATAIIMLPYFILISVYFIRTGNLNPVIYSHILIDLLKAINL